MWSSDTFIVTPSWREVLLASGMGTLEEVYGCAGGTLLKRSGSNELRRVSLGTGPSAKAVYLKKYWIARPSQVWSGFFRGVVFGSSKARTEFENLGRLRAWGLDAPEPVAFGEERRGGVVMRSFLISAEVPHAVPLHQVIARWLPTQSPSVRSEWRAKFIRSLANSTRRMHAQRFVHHDYFWRNIILSGNGLDRFYLIDSHKGRVWRGDGASGRAKDLATLDSASPAFFSRSDRLRFYLAYAGKRRLDDEDKRVIRRVLSLAEPMRERQARRVYEP